MTKEQFINKWPYLNDTRDTINPYFIADLEAVIATEIAKVQEKPQPEPNPISEPYEAFATIGFKKPQPALNPIEQAYHNGVKIREVNLHKPKWIKKHTITQAVDDTGHYWDFIEDLDFTTHPEKWELYTEPAEQPAPFDRDRFEAMFRAVVASGLEDNFEECKNETNYFIQKLDAYYATKEGGTNG